MFMNENPNRKKKDINARVSILTNTILNISNYIPNKKAIIDKGPLLSFLKL